MVEKHARRLRILFGALLASAGPATFAVACGHSSASPSQSPDVDAAADDATSATAEPDTSDPNLFPDVNGNAPPGADADADADARSCLETITVLDAGPDVDPPCALTLPCGVPAYIFPIGCELYHQEPDDGGATPIGCTLVEEAGCSNGVAAMRDGEAVSVMCVDCPGGGGRRTSGIAAPRGTAASDVGGYFARMAHDEAASVVAFERLARELDAHGAPATLRRAAQRAAKDETGHAAAMRMLARRAGARAPRVRARAGAAARGRVRSLERIAAENMTEGAVREAFGALVLAHQAQNAPDAQHRRVFAQLAQDELRHAALAFAVADWSAKKLDAAARRRIARARDRALDALAGELGQRTATATTALGLPSQGEAIRLFAGFRASVRGAAA